MAEPTSTPEPTPTPAPAEPAAPVTPPAEPAPTPAAPAAPAPFELKVPEGFTLDEATLADFKAQGEAGQKALDFAAKSRADFIAQTQANHEKQVKAWADAIAADPDLGGQNTETTHAVAQKAMVAYATPELREFFESTGLGNHPEMVRFMAKVGKALGEDSVAGTAASASKGNSQDAFLRSMYDHPTSAGLFKKE